MENYTVDSANKWDYENGFYLTCETGRIGKFVSHMEIYKKITGIPGDIFEFGVYKGTSLVRLLSFRELFENKDSRKVFGFDAFGKFPNSLSLESDKDFVSDFESNGGYGISKEELEKHLETKGISNFELIQGDICETIHTFVNDNSSTKAALIHIDVDVYEPTKVILETMWDKLVVGGVMVFDDYGTVEGETKAVDEFFKDKDIKIQKLDYYHIPSFVIKE